MIYPLAIDYGEGIYRLYIGYIQVISESSDNSDFDVSCIYWKFQISFGKYHFQRVPIGQMKINVRFIQKKGVFIQ